MVTAAADRQGRGARAGAPPRVQPAPVRPRRGQALQHPARRRLQRARRRLRARAPPHHRRLHRRLLRRGLRRHHGRRAALRQARRPGGGQVRRGVPRPRGTRAGGAGRAAAEPEVRRVLVRRRDSRVAHGEGARARLAVRVVVVVGVLLAGARRRAAGGPGAREVGAAGVRGGAAAVGAGRRSRAAGRRRAEGGDRGVPRRARVRRGGPGAPAKDEGRLRQPRQDRGVTCRQFVTAGSKMVLEFYISPP
uniref:Uncharacterized protein n=1 Tax=Setaria italica TaxID=4555 RepID=K3ZJN0_SETIT